MSLEQTEGKSNSNAYHHGVDKPHIIDLDTAMLI